MVQPLRSKRVEARAAKMRLRMAGCVIAALLVSCDDAPVCGVNLVNRAAGIGSMQHLVVALERGFQGNSSVLFLDPPDEGPVTLRLINARLARGEDGEQLSFGIFSYEVIAHDKARARSCRGELSVCANEIATAVTAVCHAV